MQSKEDGVEWGNVSLVNARPCVWYLNGEPVEMLEWGMREEDWREGGTPCAQRVRTKDGKIHTVWREKGRYPGLTYEMFDHAPGRA